jgi:hypothetical protein
LIHTYQIERRLILQPSRSPSQERSANVPRNLLRGPKFRQIDLILSKKFPFAENRNEFRTEVFNIFNLTNFAAPPGPLGSALGTAAGHPSRQMVNFTGSTAFGTMTSTVERSVGLEPTANPVA